MIPGNPFIITVSGSIYRTVDHGLCLWDIRDGAVLARLYTDTPIVTCQWTDRGLVQVTDRSGRISAFTVHGLPNVPADWATTFRTAVSGATDQR